MKKSLFVFILIVGVVFVTACGSKNPQLVKFAEKFNNQDSIKSYAEMGYKYKATVNGEKITLGVSGKDVKKVNLEFTLDDNILSGSFKLDDDSLFTGIFMVNSLISTIEEFQGYHDGELNLSLVDERIMDYTLENEGLFYKLNDDHQLVVKIDINKQIPLLDFSEVYITPKDLEDLKDYLKEGSAQKTAGYVMLHSFTMDGVSEVVIAEKYELTKCSYNSLKSLIEVMFDSKEAVEYLESNYTGIEEGNKKFGGIKIEVNATLGEDDITLPDGSYVVMKITIDHEAYKKAMK